MPYSRHLRAKARTEPILRRLLPVLGGTMHVSNQLRVVCQLGD